MRQHFRAITGSITPDGSHFAIGVTAGTPRRLLSFARVALLGGAGLAVAVVLLAGQLSLLSGMVEARAGSALDLGELPERSLVYAADGSLLAVLHSEENRAPVKLADVPQTVVDAVLAVEDARFWQHAGVDPRSAARALFANVEAGGVEQGGSTITQQVVKNALLTPDRSVSRKVKEAVLAHRLEEQVSKQEILERYLNTVYFGNGAYGVQAAAETYFGVGVRDLGPGQAALLAGIIHNPVNDDPVRFPVRARARRDMALDRMVEEHRLPLGQAALLKAEPVPTAVSRPLPSPDHYFVEHVKQLLLDDVRLGETPQERYQAVFNGGLRVHTTLEPRLQQAAQASIADILPDSKGRFTAALVSLDPRSGAVRALVGGPGFDRFKYDIATQGAGRQPGSSFKPFVLVAALEAGIGPGSTVDGRSPCTIPMPSGQEPWMPENYEGSAGGVMSVADATVRSVNCAYARLGLAVGPEKVADAARRLGITTKIDALPAMSLGAEEVRPLDMASAYGTLANDGVHHAPHFVDRVEDRRGKVVLSGRTEGKQVVSAQVARMTTDVLTGVVQRGTGTRARLPGRPVAGKTGTSQEWQNAWFAGYTPQLATAVWMGSPDGNVSMRNVGGVRVAGGTFPARIWGAFMAKALAGAPVLDFIAPDPSQIPGSTVVTAPGERPPARERPRPRTTQPQPTWNFEEPPSFEEYFPPCFPFCE